MCYRNSRLGPRKTIDRGEMLETRIETDVAGSEPCLNDLYGNTLYQFLEEHENTGRDYGIIHAATILYFQPELSEANAISKP